jgi:small redox-active disulfide protein 2
MKTIRIFGPGCANCRRLEQTAREALRGFEPNYEVQKVEDLGAMMEAGIFRTPALSINGDVVVQGRVPTATEMRSIFDQAFALSPERPG